MGTAAGQNFNIRPIRKVPSNSIKFKLSMSVDKRCLSFGNMNKFPFPRNYKLA
jgi:hypothetical protein